MTKAIEVSSLSKSYSGRSVLKELNLSVHEGSVYAFLGRNGAGKTTLIKILLGLLDFEGGQSLVLGLDPVNDGQRLLRQIGYVSEDHAHYEWMTAGELIRFTSAFYETWDTRLADHLSRRLDLRGDRTIRKMSRGEKAKLSLLLALAHRPRLLLLDEPTAGLDAVVRRQFLEETIDLIAEEGRTIFFSSHLIDEVERVADYVGILSRGSLVVETPLASLKDSFRSVKAVFSHETFSVRPPPGVFGFRRFERYVLFLVDAYDERIKRELTTQGADRIEVEPMSLEDIFVELTRGEA